MNVFQKISLSFAAVVLFVPAAASAQQYPVSQVVVTTQIAPGVTLPSPTPAVSVVATGASFLNQPSSAAGNLSFASNFSGEVRSITFVPGSYSVTAAGPSGYYFIYSNDCAGFTPLSGAVRGCVITLTNVAPQTNTCTTSWWNGTSCTAPTVPYQGSLAPNTLTCTPDYQTVAAGQAVTFRASGNLSSGYSWSTADRTFLNIGSSLSTVLQTTGVQTVIVSNGIQTATCTVNVVAGNGPINYVGGYVGTVLTNTGTTLISAIPSLPNTGFAPQSTTAFALLAVILLAIGFAVAPYVRKTVTTIVR